ncbi:MAG: hypothetical protein H3C30_09800 [Candidatus Hydrogenedentes bacterium]|nr:hypothetical protein [Candidatus Hydrogenedentota bacterium]
MMSLLRPFILPPVLCLCAAVAAANGPLQTLWEIGKSDNSTAEFALAPGGYGNFSADGLFGVGVSDPAKDWPYVHPGPADGWAGGQPRTFTVYFNLEKAPAKGNCVVVLDLADTQGNNPPRLRIELNGKAIERRTQAGSGSDACVFGAHDQGKESLVEATFSADNLKTGDNILSITNLSGSWALYDSLQMKAPKGTKLAKASLPALQMGAPEAPPLFVERDGQSWRAVRVPVRRFGEPVDAELRAEGGPVVQVRLEKGLQTVEALAPDTEQPVEVAVEMTAEGTTLRGTASMVPARKWTVYLMHHTHLDIGYTHLQSEVEEMQWHHIDKALELIEQTKDYPPEARFKWLPEGLWAVDSYLKRATPEKREAFLGAVRAGSIGLDALYGNQLTALCRPEELVELTGYARRLTRETGLAIDTAMISDVPGYTWGLIPVLAQSGVKYMSIGPNAGHRIGFTLKAWGDKPFYWVSPSGKEEVLCWMVGKAYSWFHSGKMTDGDRIASYLSELEQGGFPYDMVHVRYNIGGDNGPPDPGLPDVIRDWNARYAWPKLVMATPREAFSGFEAKYGAQVPRVTGDFTPYWEDGAASSARETAVNRDAAERLVQAQALWSILRPGPYPAADFEAAWREVILYDEHTWGAHNSISEPEVDFVKGQWAIKQAFALEADRRSRELLDRATASIRAEGDAVESLLVLNTSSWPRTGLVTLPGDWTGKNARVSGPDGKPVPSQALSSGELAFLASDVPAMGGAKYTVGNGNAPAFTPVQAAGNRIENALISVEIDPATGAISSLKAAGSDAELVDRTTHPGLNDYLYVAGRKPENPQRNGTPTITLKEKGPLVASLLIESDAPGCNRLTREVRLVAGLDHLELLDTLDKANVYEKEGVHLAFPFNVPGGTVRMDTPFAVVRPEADQMAGACKNYFTVQRWVDVSNDGLGVTWAMADTPLVQVGAITNDPTAYGWIEKLEPSTTLLAYVMNNYWETNYKASQDGPTLFRYALRPHGGYDPAAAQQFGSDFSQPLIAVPAAKNAKAPKTRVRVSPDTVIATVLKPGDDGESDILRLFNSSDQPCDAVVEWGGDRPKRVELSGLAENAGEAVQGALRLAPYEMATLRAVR